MVHVRAVRVLFVLAAVALGLPALAASHARATLTDVTFKLVDLDPNDGIEPSFQLLSGRGGLRASSVFLGKSYGLGRQWSISDVPLGTLAVDTLTSSRSGRVDIGSAGPGSAVAEIETRRRRPVWIAQAWSCNGCRIAITPNTRLVVSASHSLQVDDGPGFGSTTGPYVDGPSFASALLLLQRRAANGTWSTLDSASRSLTTRADHVAESLGGGGLLQVTYDNPYSQRSREAFLSMGVELRGQGAVLPEPSPTLLFAGGLGLLALTRRSRRAADRP